MRTKFNFLKEMTGRHTANIAMNAMVDAVKTFTPCSTERYLSVVCQPGSSNLKSESFDLKNMPKDELRGMLDYIILKRIGTKWYPTLQYWIEQAPTKGTKSSPYFTTTVLDAPDDLLDEEDFEGEFDEDWEE